MSFKLIAPAEIEVVPVDLDLVVVVVVVLDLVTVADLVPVTVATVEIVLDAINNCFFYFNLKRIVMP
jgi:hypothetical protein